MKNLFAIILLLLVPGLVLALDIDIDANNATDIAYGGTNEKTAAAAATALSVGTGSDTVHSTINLTGANGVSVGTASTNNGNINLKNSTNGFYFDIAAGVFTENHLWTLPIAYPAANNSVMTTDINGTIDYGGAMVGGTLTVTPYQRHVQIPASTSGLPANQAPLITVGTASCLKFVNAGGKYAYFQWEVPTDWVGSEDIEIEADWIAESGAIGAGETVVHKFSYRSIAEDESLLGGTVATTAATFTDGGAGTAQDIVTHTAATFTYNHANQPLVAGDHLYVQVERDTDTFTGDTCIVAFEINYNSNTLPMSN